MANTKRRANMFYVFSGPDALVQPATADQLRDVLTEMRKVQHVNRDIVASALGAVTRGERSDLTLIELQFLQQAAMGDGFIRFAARNHVTVEYRHA